MSQRESGDLTQTADAAPELLQGALDLLFRAHLASMDGAAPVPHPEEGSDLGHIVRHELRLLRLTKLVYKRKQEKIEELLNLYSALCNTGFSVVFLASSDGTSIQLGLGVRLASPAGSLERCTG